MFNVGVGLGPAAGVEINVVTLVISTFLAVFWSQETVGACGTTAIVRIAVGDCAFAWLIRALCRTVECDVFLG